LTAGYDNAVALPSRSDSEELLKENLKRFDTGKGEVALQIAKVNGATGEIAGTFESIQPSDTDMGGKEPLDVKIRGLFYARIEEAA
jgi:photosystem II oxygen-evolving enhancer protein 1